MEWWYNAIPDAVFDTGDDDFFRWTDYVNKSENQKYEENRMLPFADYREMEHWIRTIRQRQKRFLKMVCSAISSTMETSPVRMHRRLQLYRTKRASR